MEIRTGKYTNFILTVIAVLLAALLFQTSLGLASNAWAQREDRQAVQNTVPATDPALAQGLLMIASSIQRVADSLDGVAEGNEAIAQAIAHYQPETPTLVMPTPGTPTR